MQTFTPIEYVMIFIANKFGLDKKPFEERIEWVRRNGKQLRKQVELADDKAEYIRGVIELERLVNGQKFTNLPIGLDATASVLQIMGVLSGCIKTCSEVGLIDPTKPCDVYTKQVEIMNTMLPDEHKIGFKKEGLSRADIKYAFMPHFYYSYAAPIEVFGEDTLEHKAFLQGTKILAPGASELREDLAGALNENALSYQWTLPDSHTAFTKVMVTKKFNVELEELPNRNGNNSTFTYQCEINDTDKYDKSIVANSIHSYDAWIVREMLGRMNYNSSEFLKVLSIAKGCKVTNPNELVSIWKTQQLLNGSTDITENQLAILANTIENCLSRTRAPLLSVHDEFKTLATSCNDMRYWYKEILAELAVSNKTVKLMQDIYGDINIKYTGKSNGQELAKLIRQSNYAIC